MKFIYKHILLTKSVNVADTMNNINVTGNMTNSTHRKRLEIIVWIV